MFKFRIDFSELPKNSFLILAKISEMPEDINSYALSVWRVSRENEFFGSQFLNLATATNIQKVIAWKISKKVQKKYRLFTKSNKNIKETHIKVFVAAYLQFLPASATGNKKHPRNVMGLTELKITLSFVFYLFFKCISCNRYVLYTYHSCLGI